tara:strand:- start:69 stop:236 length:168 start_codon:yes stop_codon:yes gene_type:complete
MTDPHSSAPAEDVSDTPLTDALLDQFAAYYLICVLGLEMLEEARRQRAIVEQSAS